MTANSDDASSLGLARWYDLFSRGARDWLRHDEKVREAVREYLPKIIASGEVINDSTRSVRVPVKMLEHYHFRLRNPGDSQGVGQGDTKPGDVLADARPDQGSQKGEGGQGDGGIQLMLGDQDRRHRRLAVGRDAAAESEGPRGPVG